MTPTELSKASGISVPYASQILSGRKTPSLAIALKVYATTGLQLGPLAGLNRRDIEGVRKAAA